MAPSELWGPTEIRLPPEESHHAVRVLRVAPPDVVTVIDGLGHLARCATARVEGDCLVAEILETETRFPPRPEVVVYQAMAKGQKLDWAIERLAELGVAETAVFGSRRTVARWDETKADRQRRRWESIACAAAKQSRNPFVMRIGGGLSWTGLLARVEYESLAAVLWEEASLPLRTALESSASRVALVVGPEGGLERTEAESLADRGGQLVSLGPRVLRTETAPVVAASAVLYHFGLIG